MKKLRIPLILSVLLLGLLLSACTSGFGASGWAGLSADSTTAYLAEGAQVQAIRVSDGNALWSFPQPAVSGKTFFATPVLTSDGQLIVGDYSNNLYSLNPQTGVANWTFTPQKENVTQTANTGRFISAPLVTDKAIYAPSADGILYVVDLKGKSLGNFQISDQSLWATPVADANYVYLPAMDHSLYVFSIADNKVARSIDLGGAVVNAPALSQDGVLYMGTLGKEVMAVDAASGKILWKTPVSAAVWATPVIQGDAIYFGDETGDFYAVNRTNGSILWTANIGSAIVDTALLTPDGLVFGTDAGSLVAVDFNGKTLWNSDS